jgi:hypothetical protein
MNMNMNMAKIGGAITLGLFLVGVGSLAGAAANGAEDHLAVAAQCEKKAADVQASINEVLKLKAENLGHWQLRKSSPPNRDIAAADKKYDETLASLAVQKDQWVELAQYHKLRALEVQTADLSTSGVVAN